jgi:hypothetical protein
MRAEDSLRCAFRTAFIVLRIQNKQLINQRIRDNRRITIDEIGFQNTCYNTDDVQTGVSKTANYMLWDASNYRCLKIKFNHEAYYHFLNAMGSTNPVCTIHYSSEPISLENYRIGMFHLTTARPDLCSMKTLQTAKVAKYGLKKTPGYYYEYGISSISTSSYTTQSKCCNRKTNSVSETLCPLEYRTMNNVHKTQ